MKNELQVTTPDASELAQKKNAWGEFGATIYTTEIELKNTAAKTCELLSVLPTEEKDINGAEATLALAKKTRISIEGKRKEITSVMQDLTQRLMLPEKEVKDAEKIFSADLIAVKQKVADAAALLQEEKDKKAALILRMKESQAAAIEEMEISVAKKVADALEFALKSGIKPSEIEAKVAEWGTSLKYLTGAASDYEGEDKVLIADLLPPVDAAPLFKESLLATFSDYSVAYENKEKAIKRAKAEAKEKEEQAAADRRAQAAVAQIENISLDAVPISNTGRSLRKRYVIDMPETLESAMTILAALLANKEDCLPKLRVEKWFSFTPKQAGVALGKVKCENNGFAPKGIIFKEEATL